MSGTTEGNPPMRFGIAPEVLARFPNYCVGVIVATQVDNTGSAPGAGEALARAVGKVRQLLTGQPLDANPRLKVWLEAFQQAGINPSDFPPSVEALARRAVEGEGVPRINPAVDLANAASLDYLVPVGAHDLDRLRGDFWVRYSQTGDTFTPLGHLEPEPVPPGEIVFADDLAVRTRRWVWRLGERGKVSVVSRRIFLPIDGFIGDTDGAVRQAVTELANALSSTLGATVWTAFVSQQQPSVELPVPLQTGPDPLERLLNRGVVEVIPREETENRLRSGQKLRVYFGVDPTSPVIHLGHAVALRKLRQFQDLGNKVIVLIGDFTGRIGDPTDKSAMRVQLSHAEVLENAQSYLQQAAKILDLTSPTNPVEVRYNGEWWDKLTARDMIELAANFTAQQMLQRDMFQRRLDENKPIGLHEFLYPLLQGYDSVALDVDGEVGGTDQTFNMLAGRTLVRVLQDREKFVLTTPLLEGTDGRKMSKSYGNVIGVAAPPYEMYGKIMSLKDELIVRYFELLTDLPEKRLEEMTRQVAAGAVNPMDLKKQLAFDLVTRFHSAEAAREAQERFEREIQRHEVPVEIPEVELPRGGDWPIVDLLVQLKLATSKSDAKRLVEGGSVSIDGQKIVDPRAVVTAQAGMVVRGRRRQFAKVGVPQPEEISKR
ncbi:MAG TPA: tyrosine--tRNA ligase [Chloroflexota bacterium]|nr:tyrosine--tRNA ligase [Chloroflexota bacterium]